MQRAARALSDSAAEWWRSLIEASNAALSNESLDGLYRESLAAMQTVLGAEEVSILLADDSGDALVARTSIGLGEKETVQLHIPAGEGMAGRVLASRESLVINDLSRITLVSPVLRERGLRSVVAVPILSDAKVLGVLHAGSRELNHFTESDAELIGFLAERLAIALDRVRLFEEQRRLAQVSSFLADTATIMAGASDLSETLDKLAQAALPAMGDLCLIDVIDDGVLKRVVARHCDPNRQHLADRLRDDFPPFANGRHPAAEILRIGGSRWSATMPDDFLRSTTHNEEHFALTKALGFRSYLVVPIEAKGETIGALTIVSCTRPLTSGDVELAEGLARQVGSVVAKAQLLDTEAQTSHVLQASLLPTELPDIPGLEVQANYAAAASSLDVGGDFYDVARLPNEEACIMIGDVEGHDRRAAAVMGQLRSATRALACQGFGPGAVVRSLRQSWNYFGFDRLATMLLGQMDPVMGVVTMVSAGHLPPLLITDGDARYLPVSAGPLLGAATDTVEPYVIKLRPNEILLLYTDGAIDERELGLPEAMAQLRKIVVNGSPSPREACERVLDAKCNRDDDLALLALALRP